ncbi:TRAP transporter substrate-binding protein [Aureimonas mangrovi]|uniref:TRAP transporter substrate-binding protein n=1 Tax=Aureimonas mangrovi TaxID=2758041 RepID=UPI00163D9195|nr:TRAP transporter substrate-binding protein [Aureimonas mangrovi]
MTITRRTFSAFAIGALAAPAIIRPARAAPQPVTVASLLGEDKPETLIWRRIGEIVEERLPGRFAFRVAANAVLGGEREVAEGVRLGSVQASLSTVSALSSWVPEAQLLDLPFLFDGAEHLARVTQGETGTELRERLAAQDFVAPAFINYGARHLLTKTPVTRPEELRGLRIRVIQSPLHTQLWSGYGAQPTAIPIPETYNALSTGVVDAMDLTKSAYAGFRLYEVVPCLTETAHIWASGVVYYSAAFWSGLTAEEQDVLEEASAEGARFFDEAIVADEARSMEQAAGGGAQVFEPEERDAWVAGARPVWEALADTVGGMESIEAVRAQA